MENLRKRRRETVPHPKHMRISELSLYSETPPTTIKHYLRMGLLPAPIRTSKTMSYYTEEHLQQLLSIRQSKKEGLPIAAIRNALRDRAPDASWQTKSDAISNRKREGIVQAAVGLFRKKGYDATKISDIAQGAGISKATFYQYFGNKEALFFECVASIFYDIGSDIAEIREETDALEKIRLRARHFLHSYRHMIDMLNITRGVSIAQSPQFRGKLEEAMEDLVGPIRNDLETAHEQNRLRPLDSALVAHLLMGAAEYLVYYQEDFKADIDTLLTVVSALLFNEKVPKSATM